LKEIDFGIRRAISRKVDWALFLQKVKQSKLYLQIEMNRWREYTLYRFENIDIEPVHLLQMTCPSTGAYYVQRVPPTIFWANEAAKWMNNGIHPKELIKET